MTFLRWMTLRCVLCTDAIIPATAALQGYVRMISNIEVFSFESKVNIAKSGCIEAEGLWRKKNCQKRDLTDVRKGYVELQRRQMLISEDEYFLMEPVDVPGAESNTNFQRSIDCFISVPNCPLPGATGSRGGPGAPVQFADRVTVAYTNPPPDNDSVSQRSYKGAGDAVTVGEKAVGEETTEPVVDYSRPDSSKLNHDAKSFRKKTMHLLMAAPRKTVQSITNGFKKASHLITRHWSTFVVSSVLLFGNSWDQISFNSVIILPISTVSGCFFSKSTVCCHISRM